MLQTVQNSFPAGKVSSLYCVWTTSDDDPVSPLIAIWIDVSMCGFEGEFAPAAEADCTELSSDDPGSYLPKNAGGGRDIVTELEIFER